MPAVSFCGVFIRRCARLAGACRLWVHQTAIPRRGRPDAAERNAAVGAVELYVCGVLATENEVRVICVKHGVIGVLFSMVEDGKVLVLIGESQIQGKGLVARGTGGHVETVGVVALVDLAWGSVENKGSG